MDPLSSILFSPVNLLLVMKTSFTLKDRLNHWTQGLKLCYVPLFLKHIVEKLLKMSHLNFCTLTISTNFCPFKVTIFGIFFDQLFSTQKCKHSFTRKVECDFWGDFQTQWYMMMGNSVSYALQKRDNLILSN